MRLDYNSPPTTTIQCRALDLARRGEIVKATGNDGEPIQLTLAIVEGTTTDVETRTGTEIMDGKGVNIEMTGKEGEMILEVKVGAENERKRG